MNTLKRGLVQLLIPSSLGGTVSSFFHPQESSVFSSLGDGYYYAFYSLRMSRPQQLLIQQIRKLIFNSQAANWQMCPGRCGLRLPSVLPQGTFSQFLPCFHLYTQTHKHLCLYFYPASCFHILLLSQFINASFIWLFVLHQSGGLFFFFFCKQTQFHV